MSDLTLFRNPSIFFDSIFNDLIENSRLTSHHPSFPVFDQYVDKNGSQVFEFALAGYSVDDLNVNLDGSYIVISADKSSESDENNRQVRRIARRSFKEKILVRDHYDIEKVEASFKDGILKLVIPVKNKTKLEMKKVKIKT